MTLPIRSARRRWLAVAFVSLAAACADQPTAVPAPSAPVRPATSVAHVTCTASVRAKQVECGAPANGDQPYGGQNIYVKLTSSDVVAAGGIFEFKVTVQNLLNEAIGTPDGVTPSPAGIMVFFMADVATTTGTGEVTVANADGTAAFTASNQPYFRYNEVLDKDEVSSSKTWQLAYAPGVEQFSFSLKISTDVQPLLVINEVGVNPGGTITDQSGEWFEVYNAGSFPVEMQGLVIADSAASGRRPYHLISSSLIVPSGGYVVLGNTTNTTNNGGVPVDYAYGAALSIVNSLDAVKISRVYGASDTLTIDRTQFASAAISAQNGISRELKNPALDNSNMDGSNWADALVTAVYGPGGRGTPKAQNSTYTP